MHGCLTFSHPMNLVALKTAGMLPRLVSVPCNRTAAAQNLRLEIIDNELDFLALEPFWDRLLDLSSTRTPFLRWDWVSLWWNASRTSAELAVGVIRDSFGEPLAIAPMVLGRGTGVRRMLRHLSFMGGIGDIASNGMDFIIPHGQERAYAPLLAQLFGKLRNRWDTVYLPMLPAESPNLVHIVRGLRSADGLIGDGAMHSSRIINLPKTWTGLGHEHNANWEKAVTDHQARTLFAGRDLPYEKAVDAVIALTNQHLLVSQSRLLNGGTFAFHRALLNRWLPAGRAQLTFLELNGQFCAATYCLMDDGKARHYHSLWNPAFEELSIAKLSMGWAVQFAMESGQCEFESLPGGFDSKKPPAEESRQYVDIECYAQLSASAWLYQTLRKVKRGVSAPKNDQARTKAES